LVWLYIIRLKLKNIIIIMKKNGRKEKLTASRRVNLAISEERKLWSLNHCSFLLGFRTKLN